MIKKQDFIKKFGGEIKISTGLFVSTKDFYELFKEVKEINYEELNRIESIKNYGFSKYFDEWKEKGFID